MAVVAQHSARYCPGNCCLHPLTDDLMVRMSSGARWGDIILTAPRTSEEIAAEEAYVTELALSKESVKMRTYAQTQASVRRGKVMKPCKWLYLNEDGKTYSEHLTGAQCWAWEYVDPKTGKTQCPHTCKHLHPGEFGWRDEWEATETDKRALLRSLLPHTRVTFSTD